MPNSPTVSRHSTTSKVLKALGVFGGVQVVQMLCSVVRTKLVALWIGPAGVGLITLYNATVDLISTTSQLNLRQSAVRDVTIAAETAVAADGHNRALDTVTAAVRRVAFVLGTLGMIFVFLASPLLGHITFADDTHTTAFMVLSPMLLLSAIASGEWAVMQGMNRLKALAKSTMWASLTATAVAIPLFYFLRIHGIVPVLITFAACNCLYALMFRARTPRVAMTLREAFRQSRGMLSLGLYMTVSAGVALLASYIFAAWLNRTASDAAVGVYQAGYTLVNTYVGMLFTAVSMEYYPRLTSVAGSRTRTMTVVSHEIKIALWVIMAMVPAFITLSDVLLRLLYSSDFGAALPYIRLAIIGVALRAVSWCLAYTILARGDGRIYIITESASAAVFLILSIPGFKTLGYTGLGLAYIGWYGVYTAICYAVYRRRYGLRLRRGIGLLTAATLAVGVLAWIAAAWSLVATGAIAIVCALGAARTLIADRRSR